MNQLTQLEMEWLIDRANENETLYLNAWREQLTIETRRAMDEAWGKEHRN